MDSNHRANWSPPDQNPIIRLLRNDENWFENADVVAALKGPDASPNQIPVGTTTRSLQDLGPETKVIEREAVNGRRGLRIRVYSKKGLILLAMRAQTINAAAFRDWLASRSAGENYHG